jgi:hypothetical protein
MMRSDRRLICAMRILFHSSKTCEHCRNTRPTVPTLEGGEVFYAATSIECAEFSRCAGRPTALLSLTQWRG